MSRPPISARRLEFLPLEDRRMLALLGIGVTLYEDIGGLPGPVIADQTVPVGATFFVEITAQDLRDTPQGVNGLSLDLHWDAAGLEVISDPFNPADLTSPLVTPAFRGFRSGTLDESNASAMIDELRGVGPSQSGIGVAGPERFSLIRFRADAPSSAPLSISIGDIGAGMVNYLRNLQPADFAIAQPTITVTSDDPQPDPLPVLSVADVSVVEGDTSDVAAVFTVSLSEAPSQMVTVRVTTADGTASSPADYAAVDRLLTFQPGDSRFKTTSVIVRSNTLVQPDRMFTLRLSEASGAVIGDPSAVGTIVDNDVVLEPQVAYTLSLTDPLGNELPRDGASRYEVESGARFVAEVYATDLRDVSNGGVFAAYADLLANSPHVTWDPASLSIAAGFSNATSGVVTAGQGLVDEAGGTAGTEPNGSGVDLLLFRVTGTVAAQASAGTTITLSLDAADAVQRETLVFGAGEPVLATYETESLIVTSSSIDTDPQRGWQNVLDPLDVNGDGLRTPRDVLLIVNELNSHGPHLLAGDGPGVGQYQLDVNGDGGVSRLDALLVFNYLTFGTLPGNPVGEGEGGGRDSSEPTSIMATDPPVLALPASAANIDQAVAEDYCRPLAEMGQWMDQRLELEDAKEWPTSEPPISADRSPDERSWPDEFFRRLGQ